MHHKQWQRSNAVALLRSHAIYSMEMCFGWFGKNIGYRVGSADAMEKIKGNKKL